MTSSWSQHGDKLLSNHARYANCTAVQARPALRSEFAHFLMDERVSLLIEQLRIDVRQHAFRPAAVRLLAQPDLLHRVVGQAIRRSLVKVKRGAGTSRAPVDRRLAIRVRSPRMFSLSARSGKRVDVVTARSMLQQVSHRASHELSPSRLWSGPQHQACGGCLIS